ncbi:MAG: 2-succinyl-6-hydroxy-2,4-cyclohexadiene-1-carboxylate synthase [Polyangiaceae bacterium UTPRO1]|jgi:2-succinyl-6-hydroxy-2,4-cyclohexadiene-1-carboxylate synthase|nr:2-succinyl-6-hydroxy-2,4-cyclohexadiene-1-carboxylate synthase [Myxococcales bacterium]OQY68139.1 MAG: 2-succinyl-6-hydroxy-2,4-cyclohexadiene-1-carboxylate synthase [Polyangiaceae bacterium UTPRO1]
MIRRIEMAAGTVALSDERPVRGAARAVRPLVLLHGFTGSHESWAAARATFRAQRRVIAIDLPGHGATVVRDAAFDWSLAAAADLVAATLAALRIGSADVLGYSMGGRVALQMALAHPARVGRLVLESASAGLESAALRARRRAADGRLAAAIEGEGIAAFVRRWEALPLFRSLARQPEAVRDALRRQRLACKPAGLAASLRGMGLGAQPWLGGELETLPMPVLLVSGERDAKFTRIAASLLPLFAAGTHEIVAGAGHLPHLEQPARFLRVVCDFLDGGGRRREFRRSLSRGEDA